MLINGNFMVTLFNDSICSNNYKLDFLKTLLRGQLKCIPAYQTMNISLIYSNEAAINLFK